MYIRVWYILDIIRIAFNRARANSDSVLYANWWYIRRFVFFKTNCVAFGSTKDMVSVQGEQGHKIPPS